MANLLPKQSKQTRLWQKRKRYTLVLAVVMIVVMSTVYAAMLPITIYTYIIGADRPSVLTAGKSKTWGAQRKELKVKLDTYKSFVDSVTLISQQRSITTVVDEVVSGLRDINGVELSRVEARFTDGHYSITLAGSAQERSDVVVVKAALLAVSDVVLDSFPVSNFAPNAGVYNFTVKLTHTSSNNISK